MISFDQESSCPCGSDRKAVDCCIPNVPPVADKANSWTGLNLKMSGVDYLGREMGLPRDLRASIELKQPHQLDATIEQTAHGLMKTLFDASMDQDHFLSFSSYWGHLVDALYAVRYHQRQFLARMRIILSEAPSKKLRGSPQLELRFADIALKHELESLLVRTRASLDAAARLASVCLDFKPMSFGKLLNHCKKPKGGQRQIPAAKRKKLKTLYEKHQEWIDPITALRHSVVHEGAFEELQGVSYTISGVERPRVSGRPADEYCIEVWKALCAMIDDLFRIVLEKD